jgi:ankyrin repeat protein
MPHTQPPQLQLLQRPTSLHATSATPAPTSLQLSQPTSGSIPWLALTYAQRCCVGYLEVLWGHVPASDAATCFQNTLTAIPVGLLLQDGWTPLCWAARNGKDKMVQMLLGARAAVNATTNVRCPSYSRLLWFPQTILGSPAWNLYLQTRANLL